MTATAVAAFVAGVASTAAVTQGDPNPGVLTEGVGGHVLAATPTGFAWGAGIRAGQTVVALRRAEQGWELVTTDGVNSFVADAGPAGDALQDALPLAIGGLVAGALALVFRQTRREWVVAVAAVGLQLAETPLWLHGNPQLSTGGMLAAAAIPGGWAAINIPGGRAVRTGAVVALACFLALWVVARMSDGAYDTLEGIRAPIALWTTTAVVVVRVIVPRFRGQPVNLTRPAFFDLVVVAALAAGSVSLVVLAAISPVILGLALLVALLVLPTLRERLGPAMRRAVLGDIREHARAEGADEERAKLARELHDTHLQELTAVIRRLEVKAGTEAERDDLRDLVARLRNVASELRPPVLDDFGLPAALEYLAERTSTPECAVGMRVANHTGLDTSHRPPADVELAIYRIIGEALANSIHHARGTTVEVRGLVSADAVDLEVADNGVGVSANDLRAAARRNRLGLGSMRRRALAIDADFSIRGTAHGTIVRVAWHR
jgi:signal transduction histidine kinase